jgi:hypothetical protein
MTAQSFAGAAVRSIHRAGQTFTQYVGEAVRQELMSANVLDDRSPLTLEMKMQRIDFSSALGATNWYIDGEYTVGKQTFRVATVYNDKSSYFGNRACANIALYLQKAVAEHVRQVFANPALRQMVGAVPPSLQQASGTVGDGASTSLRRLDALLKDGVISKEEHAGRRKQILEGI